MAKLHLHVVSQEKELIHTTVESLTAMTIEGEVTILPGHIPLFTKLSPGELRFSSNQKEESIVVSQGFLTVSHDNSIIIMVDTAVHARDLSEQRAQQAIKQATETMKLSQDKRELLMAEASLKLAMLELRVAQKSRRTSI